MPSSFISPEGIDIKGSLSIANAFNAYFIDSIETLASQNNPTSNGTNKPNQNSIFLSTVTPDEIFQLLLQLPNKKSTGSDELPAIVLKKTAYLIAEPLAYVTNLTFEYGFYPEQLKKSIITPVHKKHSKNEIVNYRPVALLPVISKIFERAFYNRLLSFLDKYSIIKPEQFGFTCNKSTEDAILRLYNHILEIFEGKARAAGVFFDLSRAFDTLDHKLLLHKLDSCGIRGKPLEWLASYLQNRKQSVKIKFENFVTLSSYLESNFGVPQGSILGPILFLIFINDLNFTQGFLTLYADDTSAVTEYKSDRELQQCVRSPIDEMVCWSRTNGLTLNSSKTEIVLFSPIMNKSNDVIKLKIENETIQNSYSTKFLGLWIDAQLSWKVHIDSLCKKLASRCFAIIQLKSIISFDTLKMYYFSCVHSTLKYGILAWGGVRDIERVLVVQKRILRCMLGLPYGTSCRQYFIKHKILTVCSVYLFESICHVRLHSDKYQRVGDINNYKTRNADRMYAPLCLLTQVQKGPNNFSIKIYNKLPRDIINIRGYPCFRRTVKEFLVRNCYYSINEYLNDK